jgi:hypothetical protein
MIVANQTAMLSEKRDLLIFDEQPLLPLAFDIHTDNAFRAAVDINHHADMHTIPLIEQFWGHLHLLGLPNTASQIINHYNFPI